MSANMELRILRTQDVKKGTRVFMRVDCNVPLKGRKVVSNSAWRLEQTLDDIKTCLHKGAIVIVAGHLGRPDGVTKLSLSLRPIARWYEEQLGLKAVFIKDVTSKASVAQVRELPAGTLVVLENLRFYPNEEHNCLWFAKRLSRYADIYVNNAFGVCHRKHASVKAITRFLPSFAGSVVAQEVQRLSAHRKQPFVFVLGGVKLETKMPTLMRLGKEAEHILLGGGVAIALTSFDQKRLLSIGDKVLSRSDRALAKKARALFKEKIVAPLDYVGRRDDRLQVLLAQDVLESDALMDIGPKTIALYRKILREAESVVFNGAMGSLELSAQEGTVAIAKALCAKQMSLVGGGDTVGFLQSKKLLKSFSFVSTGGGAMLAYLAGEKLPGLEVLKK